MNLMTKFQLGEMVTLKCDLRKTERIITGIEIYLDGGYQYKTACINDNNEMQILWCFELEIDESED